MHATTTLPHARQNITTTTIAIAIAIAISIAHTIVANHPPPDLSDDICSGLLEVQNVVYS